MTGREVDKNLIDGKTLTLSKVVALMGAHTFGQPHFQISMFPYTWTRSSVLK